MAEGVRRERVVTASSTRRSANRWPDTFSADTADRSLVALPLWSAAVCAGAPRASFPLSRAFTDIERRLPRAMTDGLPSQSSGINATTCADGHPPGKILLKARTASRLSASQRAGTRSVLVLAAAVAPCFAPRVVPTSVPGPMDTGCHGARDDPTSCRDRWTPGASARGPTPTRDGRRGSGDAKNTRRLFNHPTQRSGRTRVPGDAGPERRTSWSSPVRIVTRSCSGRPAGRRFSLFARSWQ
jgi:hypothetical protein